MSKTVIGIALPFFWRPRLKTPSSALLMPRLDVDTLVSIVGGGNEARPARSRYRRAGALAHIKDGN
jgi:hypothetical protein